MVTSKEILDYCSISSHGKVTLHKGSKNRSVIGNATPHHEKDCVINIHYKDDIQGIPLQHQHHQLPSLSPKSSFTFDGKPYYWKGQSEFVDEKKNLIIARYQADWWEDKSHRISRLNVQVEGISMQDFIVFSWFVVQERAKEHRESVHSFDVLKITDFQGGECTP